LKHLHHISPFYTKIIVTDLQGACVVHDVVVNTDCCGETLLSEQQQHVPTNRSQ